MTTFQSTLPRGERRGVGWMTPFAASFNPRSRGGSDLVHILEQRVRVVSIHAPAGGATWRETQRRRRCRVSIHAPAGGATYGTSCYAQGIFSFQSTLPRGERLRR